MKLGRLLRRLFLAGTLLALGAFMAAQDRSVSSPTAADAGSQAEKPQASVPLIRSTANLVVVDVVVSHDGRPVKGLQQQAFHIFEDGREQTIKAFEEHGPGSNESKTEQPPLPPNTYTNVPEQASGSAVNVLLLDALNTPVEDQAYARRKILDYLKTIPPGTRMAVFTLASRLRLVQGFTTDSSVLLAALNRSVPVPSSALLGNQGESAADRFAALPTIDQSAMANVIASLHQFEADEQSAFVDRRVQITVDALKQLALYLGAVPGRKNLIWFSGSFPLSLTPESPLDPFKSLRGFGGQVQQLSDLLTAGRVAVYPVDARGLIAPTATSASQNRPAAIGPVMPGMRNGTIDSNAFPSDPSLAGDRTNAELATMLQLAEQTGGTPFYNRNDVQHGLAKAIENGSTYYTLTYSPEDKKFDGRFRKLQVKLAGHDHVAYRRGYFADPQAAHNSNTLLNMASPGLLPDAPPSSQVFFHARVLAAGDPAAQDLQPQAGPAGDLAARLKPPVTRYWIEYTADMNQVSAELDANGLRRSNLEFIAIAYDRDGNVINASRHAYRLGIPPAKYDEMLQTGYSVRNEIDLPGGEVWLRLAVHDVLADHVGSIEVPLRIIAKKAE
jgi:VWFA-related protein